jgi:hypothetical protein
MAKKFPLFLVIGGFLSACCPFARAASRLLHLDVQTDDGKVLRQLTHERMTFWRPRCDLGLVKQCNRVRLPSLPKREPKERVCTIELGRGPVG